MTNVMFPTAKMMTQFTYTMSKQLSKLVLQKNIGGAAGHTVYCPNANRSQPDAASASQRIDQPPCQPTTTPLSRYSKTAATGDFYERCRSARPR